MGTEDVITVPISEKYLLTIEEARAYFNIGRDKIYELAKIRGAEYVVHNGRNILINRKKLEEYLIEEMKKMDVAI